ncbi:hypothetical protein DYB32_006666 [Aphanomyces invadans]|uniref:TM7S3/TM198-like domain-containing protein n=1 Tax=Aphanomyces invadans TaxID=157072 RepID=A0A418AR22_9STRA|nr:hypothetical protein DYB32_006666 [Aphanomyces invadans]
MALGRLVLVGYGLLVATAQPVISNPLVLLLNSGVQAVAQRPAYVLGVVSTAPPVPPVSTLVPASEDNNPVVLMLNVGIRGGSGTFKHEPNLPQLNTAAKGDPVDENDLDLLRTPQSKVHLMSGIAAALSIVSGAILAFLGFKLLRISALLCGFAVGGLTSYVLSTILFPDPSSIVLAAWLSLLVGGLLIGVICMLVEQVGNFIVGASGGMALAILMHISFNYLFWPSNPNAALYVWGASLSLVLGLLAVLVGKPLLVVATGLTGGLTFIWGIGYFAGRYPANQATSFQAHDRQPVLLLPPKFAVSHVTPRKDQSMRGTCWDFATIGVLEQSYRAEAIRKGYLSENQYVSPFNWYQCGNNAAPVVTPHNGTAPSTAHFNRTKAFDEGVGACLSAESRIYANVNVQPLHLECIDATACSREPNTTYFVRNTTDWGDRMTVMCVWEYNPRLDPVAHEVRPNDPDRCGFYFMPYATIRQYIAQFQGFYVNSFDIEWATQSFGANRHKYPHLNYTLLDLSTHHQNHNKFDGPFPHARVVAPKEFQARHP